MFLLINSDWLVISKSTNYVSSEWCETIVSDDEKVEVWWVYKDWEFTKWEELEKEEQVQEFLDLKEKIIVCQHDNIIKWYLNIDDSPKKWETSDLETLTSQLNELYNSLVKTYWEDIKNELF